MQDRIEIRDIPERRLFGLPHKGPYPLIAEAYGRLFDVMERATLMPRAGSMIALYYDPPGTVAEADQRSLAAYEMDRKTELPEGLEEVILPAGPAAVIAHHGSYDGLHAAYDALFREWLPQSGREPAGPPYELYHNTPDEVAADRLVTDIHLPLKP